MKSVKQLFSLEGRNAIITGGAGILGKCFTEGLCEMGANVAVVDPQLDSARELAGVLSKKYGKKVLALPCDVSNPASVQSTVDQCVKEFGQIHILHNNAASKGRSLDDFFEPFESFKLETWKEVMDVNLNGMFLMAQAVGKHMVREKIKGSIIQTASIYGIMAPDHRIYEGSSYQGRPIGSPAVYSASKAGVVGLTQYLATYFAPHGIRVNTLIPGGVESGQNENFKSKYSQRIPLARMAKDYEIVGALVYLASEASSYVTGQNMIVDGGLNAW